MYIYRRRAAIRGGVTRENHRDEEVYTYKYTHYIICIHMRIWGWLRALLLLACWIFTFVHTYRHGTALRHGVARQYLCDEETELAVAHDCDRVAGRYQALQRWGCQGVAVGVSECQGVSGCNSLIKKYSTVE